MKLIKLALISAFVFFGLLVAMTSLMPSQVRISRAVDIQAPKETISSLLFQLNEWDQWNEYVKMLSGKTVSDSSIHSKEMTIQLTGLSDTIAYTQWTQASGKSYPGVLRMINHDGGATVQWYFDFKVKWYPWDKIGSIVYDKQIGPVMQTSLSALKAVAEATAN